jgi:hypothetical protein
MNSLSFNPSLRHDPLFETYQKEGRLNSLIKNDLQLPKLDSFEKSGTADIGQMNLNTFSRLSLMNQLKNAEAESALQSRNLDKELQEGRSKEIEAKEAPEETKDVSNDPYTKVTDDFANLFLAAGFTADEAKGFADLIANTLKASEESGIEQLNISVTSIHSINISQTYTKGILQQTEDGEGLYNEVSRTKEFSALSMRSINISMNTETGEISVTAEKVNRVTVNMSRTEKQVTIPKEQEEAGSEKTGLTEQADYPPFMEAYRTLFALLDKLMNGEQEESPFKNSFTKVREVTYERNVEEQLLLKFSLDMLTPVDENKEVEEKGVEEKETEAENTSSEEQEENQDPAIDIVG